MVRRHLLQPSRCPFSATSNAATMERIEDRVSVFGASDPRSPVDLRRLRALLARRERERARREAEAEESRIR